jgi:hypothetical protein
VAGGAGFSITGAAEMAKKLADIGTKVPLEMGHWLYREANYAKTITNRQFVPKHFSNLANSGNVELPVFDAEGINVSIYYGGPAAPYALAIHEFPDPMGSTPRSWWGKNVGDIHSMNTKEPWSLEGRGPKYLERGLKAIMPGIEGRMAAALAKALSGGV